MPHALVARPVKLQRLNAFLRMGIMATSAWRRASANPVIVRGAASFTPLAGHGKNQRTAPVTGNGALCTLQNAASVVLPDMFSAAQTFGSVGPRCQIFLTMPMPAKYREKHRNVWTNTLFFLVFYRLVAVRVRKL